MGVLLVVFAVIVFVVVLIVVFVRALIAQYKVKRIPDGPLPPLPGDILNNAANPEVYSLGYLRAGTRGVAQVALLGLLRRGMLESAGGSLSPAGPRPNALFLQPLESALLDFVSTGKPWPAITRPDDLKLVLEGHCAPFRQHFEQIGLLSPKEEFDGRNRRRRRAYLDAIEAACPTGAVPARPGGPPPLLIQDQPLLMLALHGPKPLLAGMYAEFASHWMTQGSGTTRNEYEEEGGGFVFSGGGSDDSSSSSSDSDSSSASYSSSDD